MSYISDLLSELKDNGIAISLKEDNSLQIKAKKGAMTQEFMSKLKEAKDDIVAFLSKGIGKEYICSFQQERLCFLDKFEEGENQAYAMPSLLKIEGKLDKEALEKSLKTIVDRHEVLRCNFIENRGEFKQYVKSSDGFKIDYILAKDINIEEEVQKLLAKSFDLKNDFLFRVNLFELSEKEYYLFINMHHIVSDGWSIDILVREFITLYHSYTKGIENVLEPLKIQYGDYAKWQRDYLANDILEHKLSFWKEHLKDAEILELPTTYPRPAIQSYKGDRFSFSIDAHTTTQLNHIAQDKQATLFMALLSALNVLLYRYSGQNDIVVGSPIANRNRVELEELIGFFVNTLPIRTKLDDDMSFDTLLSYVKDNVLKVYEHQDVPFEKIVDALNIPRDTSHSPLFSVMFVLQNNKQEVLSLPNLVFETQEIKNHTSKFDITIEVTQKDGALECVLEYATDLFSHSFMKQFVGNFEVLLKSIVKNPHQKIWQYDILTSKEKEELLFDFNKTKVEYPNNKAVHHIFEEQAKRYAHKVALIHNQKSLTYEELNAKANQVAHYLIDKGLKKGDKVALVMDRSFEIIIGILGIIKAGGVYLPIDTSYPQDRIDYILKDSNAFMTLYQDSVQQAIKETTKDYNPCINVTADDLIYIIYTSGSTGNPKGVMVEHRGVSRLVLAQKYVDFDEDIVMLQSNSISFDVATFDIYGALLVGGTLVLYGENKLDLLAINHTINEYAINTMWLTSALFEQWVFALDVKLDTLRYVLAGGDVVNAYAVNQLHKKLPNVTIIDGYGPTENTTFTTTYRCDRSIEYKDIPIGKPIANTTVYILDKHLQLVPKGVIGELYTGGDGVARGYHNKAELTNESFLSFNNERVYKTGDLVKYQTDGNIIYLGREDNQVKIRGFRIELGEIEQHIVQQDGIKECVVIAKEKQLVSYITVEDGYSIDIPALKKELLNHLPEYMVPFSINILDQMPINPNGKADRKALAKRDITVVTTKEFVAPKDENQKVLASLFVEILGIKQDVGIYDNFFELGGHSLLATKLSAYIKDRFEVEIPLKVLFANPTIDAISKYISTHSKVDIPTIQRLNLKESKLSFTQERLWFLDRFEGSTLVYNIPILLEIEGILDKQALIKSFETIIDRHEVLRSNFIQKDTQVYQVVKNHNLIVETLKTDDFITEVEKRVNLAFDLEKDLLFRVTLFETSPNNYKLFVNMHHIVSDGWSIDVMIKEFIALYNSYLESDQNPLDELQIQYSDYAMWQREYLSGEVLEQKISYWKEALAGIEPLLLPTTYPREAMPSYRGDRVLI